MRHAATADSVSKVYRDGLQGVQHVAAQLDKNSWDQPACGLWTATETARHLLAVSIWYHEWLDRALEGEISRPFLPEAMDAQNAAALSALGGTSGPDAVVRFAANADAYLERVLMHWDLPFGYPYGIVTAGLHCGVAAAEWEIHAWDLGQAADHSHEPRDPASLFVAAAHCVAAAEGGIKGATLRRLAPMLARRSPWRTLLRRSGRNPST